MANSQVYGIITAALYLNKPVMKLYWLFLFIVLATSCNTASFTTPNNMQNMYGVLYMQDGRQLQGDITVSLENGFTSRDYIRFAERNSRDRQRIPIDEIRGYSVRGDFYAPKMLDRGGIFGGDRMRFLKRLTKEDSRIQLYELFERRTTNNNGFTRTYNEYRYYISLPTHDKYTAWDIDGRRLVPNFEDKMSEYVQDCAILADKIKRKEKGYFYAQISLSEMKRISTVLNIIDEYNACR
jgi:hypothetical protein